MFLTDEVFFSDLDKYEGSKTSHRKESKESQNGKVEC